MFKEKQKLSIWGTFHMGPVTTMQALDKGMQKLHYQSQFIRLPREFWLGSSASTNMIYYKKESINND